MVSIPLIARKEISFGSNPIGFYGANLLNEPFFGVPASSKPTFKFGLAGINMILTQQNASTKLLGWNRSVKLVRVVWEISTYRHFMRNFPTETNSAESFSFDSNWF